ncbi:hypothetical protein FJY70_02320 [candidate division WOR-3 bacterium]|nr:hypothetical protein [candidate division WOR-3 bacterium]
MAEHEHRAKGVRPAEYGEWGRKGATLSDVTARKEYGVSEEFIISGIRSGKLEYRDGAIWGNPYLRLLRRQLEEYLADELGDRHLMRLKSHAELRKVKKEMKELEQRLKVLQTRKKELEESLTGETTDRGAGKQPSACQPE